MSNDIPFVSIAVLKAKQGKTDELKKELLAMIEPTRKEPGCLEYILFESTERAGDFYMREAFKNKAAFDFHVDTPHFRALAAKLDGLLGEPLQLISLKRVSS